MEKQKIRIIKKNNDFSLEYNVGDIFTIDSTWYGGANVTSKTGIPLSLDKDEYEVLSREMKVLKGAEVSAKIKEQVAQILGQLAQQGSQVPKLAIVRVGENPDDLSYERGATKKMEAFGLRVQSYVFPRDISDAEFKAEFRKINDDADVTGILLLRPLPKQICEADIEKMIAPEKDLDGISPTNIAKVFAGDTTGFAPCTAEAVVEVLKANQIPITGKCVTIVGRSMVVGKPLAMLMLKENATVTVCHTRTVDLPGACRQAEILVAAAGKAKMLNGDYVGQDAVVIDVGINVDEDGKLCGDVDFESILELASAATPVPGGVGAVTTAVLAKHLVQAAQRQQHGQGQSGFANGGQLGSVCVCLGS